MGSWLTRTSKYPVLCDRRKVLKSKGFDYPRVRWPWGRLASVFVVYLLAVLDVNYNKMIYTEREVGIPECASNHRDVQGKTRPSLIHIIIRAVHPARPSMFFTCYSFKTSCYLKWRCFWIKIFRRNRIVSISFNTRHSLSLLTSLRASLQEEGPELRSSEEAKPGKNEQIVMGLEDFPSWLLGEPALASLIVLRATSFGLRMLRSLSHTHHGGHVEDAADFLSARTSAHPQ